MPWTWRYEKADGTVIGTDELQEAIFASQGDAESWLGENWRALLAAGVDQVLAARRLQDRVRPDEPAPRGLTRPCEGRVIVVMPGWAGLRRLPDRRAGDATPGRRSRGATPGLAV